METKENQLGATENIEAWQKKNGSKDWNGPCAVQDTVEILVH
jgi:hypothetical protein